MTFQCTHNSQFDWATSHKGLHAPRSNSIWRLSIMRCSIVFYHFTDGKLLRPYRVFKGHSRERNMDRMMTTTNHDDDRKDTRMLCQNVDGVCVCQIKSSNKIQNFCQSHFLYFTEWFRFFGCDVYAPHIRVFSSFRFLLLLLLWNACTCLSSIINRQAKQEINRSNINSHRIRVKCHELHIFCCCCCPPIYLSLTLSQCIILYEYGNHSTIFFMTMTKTMLLIDWQKNSEKKRTLVVLFCLFVIVVYVNFIIYCRKRSDQH